MHGRPAAQDTATPRDSATHLAQLHLDASAGLHVQKHVHQAPHQLRCLGLADQSKEGPGGPYQVGQLCPQAAEQCYTADAQEDRQFSRKS